MDDRDKLMALANEHGDFVTGEDGFVVFWPDGFGRGALSAWMLRALAEELDRRNQGRAAELERALASRDDTEAQP